MRKSPKWGEGMRSPLLRVIALPWVTVDPEESGDGINVREMGFLTGTIGVLVFCLCRLRIWRRSPSWWKRFWEGKWFCGCVREKRNALYRLCDEGG